MSSMHERAIRRRATMTITKVDLHSDEHHSFHAYLDVKSAWELLAKLSKEAWMQQTGQEAPTSVDKSIVRFITQS